MDRDNRVQAIVLSTHQHLEFDSLNKSVKSIDKFGKLLADVFSFTCEFDQGLEVVNLPLDRPVQLDTLVQACFRAKNVAGSLLVRPKVGLGNDLFEFANALLLASGVKGTSVFPDFGL
jgi:hypothetical protein